MSWSASSRFCSGRTVTIRRGDLTHGRHLGVLAFRDDLDGDVAVGDGSDELIAFNDRREADILVANHLRGVGHGLLCVDRARLRRHTVAHALRHSHSS